MKYYCVAMALSLLACGVEAEIGSPVECGAGTVLQNNICVAQGNASNTPGNSSDVGEEGNSEKPDNSSGLSMAGSKLVSTDTTRTFSWDYKKAANDQNVNWAISSGTGLSQCAAANSYTSGLSDGDEQLYIRVKTTNALSTSCPIGNWNISDQNCHGSTGEAYPNCAYLRRWNRGGEYAYCSENDGCSFTRAQGGVVVVSDGVEGCRVQIEVNVGDQRFAYDFISRQETAACFEF